MEPVKLNVNQFTGEPTTKIDIAVNLPATQTEAGSAGALQQLSIEYYDNLGTSENVKLEFSPTVPASGSSNEWTLTLKDTAQNNAVIGEYLLNFDDSPNVWWYVTFSGYD